MARNTNILFIYHACLTLWTLTVVGMGLVITWSIFYLQEPRGKKRPGINIKEF